MVTKVFTNDASTLLVVALSAIDTTIQVTASTGSLFPSAAELASKEADLTLINADGSKVERVTLTDRTGDVFTVTRSVSPLTWDVGDRIDLRVVKSTLDNFAQKDGLQQTGLNSELLQGLTPANLRDRTTHTGVAPAGSIAQGAGSGLDADGLDGQEGSYYLNRANHTGAIDVDDVSDGGGSIAYDTAGSFSWISPVTGEANVLVIGGGGGGGGGEAGDGGSGGSGGIGGNSGSGRFFKQAVTKGVSYAVVIGAAGSAGAAGGGSGGAGGAGGAGGSSSFDGVSSGGGAGGAGGTGQADTAGYAGQDNNAYGTGGAGGAFNGGGGANNPGSAGGAAIGHSAGGGGGGGGGSNPGVAGGAGAAGAPGLCLIMYRG